MMSSTPKPSPAPVKPRLWTYLKRALKLKCPECGQHPLFVPLKKVRSLFNWFYPLDGCPHCGYAYEREEGYFLLATWVVNYGATGAIGLATGLLLQTFTKWSFWTIAITLLLIMPLVSLLFARHAKAIYLAIDHYFDPHRTG
jgi:uncharacterized protein (DUF983 family)